MSSVHEPAEIDPASFAPIAVARRSGHDESVHFGAAVVVDADGVVVTAVGDPQVRVYPRSALKPLQATAMVRSGLDLPGRLLAAVCASHSGEPGHLDAVVEILRRHGLSVDDLANTPTLPYDAAARSSVLRAGGSASSLQQNCSGKHAGMLATCVVNGWPTVGYHERDHPLQVRIAETIESVGAPVHHVGVDGCGAPTHVLTLADLARAIGRVAGPSSPAPSVGVAMRACPWMVGGTDRDVTRWTEAVDGLIAKEGAAGVMVLGLADGSAAALKVADGSDAARQAVTVELLRGLGVDVDGEHAAVRDRVAVRVLGHGRPVGAVDPLPWRRAGATR